MKFLRSQDQLALWNPRGTGREYSHSEAVKAFGQELVDEVIYFGSASLIADRMEPAKSIRQRRIDLNLSEKEVASYTGLTEQTIKNAENPDFISKIRDLEKIAASLNLDDKRLGFSDSSNLSKIASLRFKELTENKNRRYHSTRLIFSEALWIMSKTQDLLSQPESQKQGEFVAWAHSVVGQAEAFEKPYQQGYFLARKVRDALRLSSISPINSTLDIWENALSVHVVHAKLPDPISAVTIYSEAGKGIVLNHSSGISPRVRRVASVHELCHFLFDPKDYFYAQLDSEIEHIAANNANLTHEEKRANAFAVEFLCPSNAIKLYKYKMKSERNFEDESESQFIALLSFRLSNDFGIGISSMVSHVMNYENIDRSLYKDILSIARGIHKKLPSHPVENWEERELSYRAFLMQMMRPSRVGQLTKVVLRSLRDGEISEDTAISYLLTDREKLKNVKAYADI